MPDREQADRIGRFLLYFGDFLTVWSTFDMILEVIIMRELNISAEKTSILCAGLGFGSKASIACSLLNTRPSSETARTVALIREAQTIGERNSFAHGFFLVNESTAKFQLIRREIRDFYSARIKELDCATMQKHSADFIPKFREIEQHALISEKDLADYAKEIEAHALALASLGKPLPALPTNSAKAKKK